MLHFVTEQSLNPTTVINKYKCYLNIKRYNSEKVAWIIISVLSKGVCQTTVIPRFGTAEKISISAIILQKITETQPPYPISSKMLSIPDGIKLADPVYFRPQAVDLLIGAGTFWNLLLPEKKILGQNLPVLQETNWTISGPINSLRQQPKTSLTSNLDLNSSTVLIDKLDELVKSFWEIESRHPKDVSSNPRC